MDKVTARYLKQKLVELVEDNRYKTNRVELAFSPGDLMVLIDALDLAEANDYKSSKDVVNKLSGQVHDLQYRIQEAAEALGYE